MSAAYLASPPGGRALLGAGGRKRLGRDVQHRGPLARALPRVRRRRASFGRTTLQLQLPLRLGSRGEAKPPAHFRLTSGVAQGEARRDATRQASGGRGQWEGRRDDQGRGGTRGEYACSVNSAPRTSAPQGGDSYSADRLKRE